MKKVKKLLCFLVAFVMLTGLIGGLLPATGISAATEKVEVSAKKKLLAEMQDDKAKTIVFKTDKNIKLDISAKEKSSNKKLIIEAPNAKVTNKASFASITIKAAKSYTEAANGNTIYLNDDEISFAISGSKTAEKLFVSSKNANITVQKKAVIKNMVFDKKSAGAVINAKESSATNISINKVADVNIKGSDKAVVIISSKAKGSTVTSSIPVSIKAEKNMTVNLNKGSKGSAIDRKKKNVKVTLNNKTSDVPLTFVAGEEIYDNIVISKTTFPDDNFRECILEKVDTDKDGILSEKELSTDYISCNGREIKDLTGIRFFTKLKNLYCQNNNISSLDLRSNKLLTELVCDRNVNTDRNIVINKKTFPDETFRKYIVQFDIDKDGFLSEDEIEAVKTIDVSGQSIKSLTGIDIFKKLDSLNASNTNISRLETVWIDVGEVDLSNCTNLTYYHGGNNYFDGLVKSMKSLNVTGCTNLQELSCYSNQLTELNVKDCKKLQFLNCWGNQLTELDLSNNTMLKDLFCDSNQLTKLDLSNNTKLGRVYFGGNKITSIDLSNNTLITELECWGNGLKELDLVNLNKITRLSCYGNELASVNLIGKTELSSENVYADGNTKLIWNSSDIDENNNSRENTETENTEENSTVSVVISEETFPDEKFRAYVLDNLDADKDGKLAGTELEADDIYCPTLGIKDLTGIEYFEKCKWLCCFENSISNLDISKNTYLENLSCGHNPLGTLDVSNNKKLKGLSCESNSLTELKLNENIELEYLYCSGNRIETLDLRDNINLIKLNCDKSVEAQRRIGLNEKAFPDSLFRKYMSGFDTDKDGFLTNDEINAVKDIDVSGQNIKTLDGIGLFEKLDTLNCSNTKISTLDTVWIDIGEVNLSGCKNLVYYHCGYNGSGSEGKHMVSLNVDGCINLEELYCYENQLTSLNVKDCAKLKNLYCYGNKIKSLDLSQNPLLNEGNVSIGSDTAVIWSK